MIQQLSLRGKTHCVLYFKTSQHSSFKNSLSGTVVHYHAKLPHCLSEQKSVFQMTGGFTEP